MNRKAFSDLHAEVLVRPGAAERLVALRRGDSGRDRTLRDTQTHGWSQSGLAAELTIIQAPPSQLEDAQYLTLSRLRNYLEPLGARLQILAVVKNDGEEYSIPIRVGQEES